MLLQFSVHGDLCSLIYHILLIIYVALQFNAGTGTVLASPSEQDRQRASMQASQATMPSFFPETIRRCISKQLLCLLASFDIFTRGLTGEHKERVVR